MGREGDGLFETTRIDRQYLHHPIGYEYCQVGANEVVDWLERRSTEPLVSSVYSVYSVYSVSSLVRNMWAPRKGHRKEFLQKTSNGTVFNSSRRLRPPSPNLRCGSNCLGLIWDSCMEGVMVGVVVLFFLQESTANTSTTPSATSIVKSVQMKLLIGWSVGQRSPLCRRYRRYRGMGWGRNKGWRIGPYICWH